MWHGVTKILQEGKTFQINIFFIVEHKIQGTIWYGVTTIYKRLSLATQSHSFKTTGIVITTNI